MDKPMQRQGVLGALVILALSYGRCGMAQETDTVFGLTVTTDFFSKYVWRGQNITNDWVFQPGVCATWGDVTLGYWGSLDLTDENGEPGEFIEHDWYAGCSTQINELIGFSVGAIYYYFPSLGDTAELYWGLSLDAPASPSLTVYHDVDAVDGAYAALSVHHSIEKLGHLPFGIDLAANLGWGSSNYNDAYWGVESCELNDLTLTAGFPFEIVGTSVTPRITCITLLGGDIRDVADDETMVVAGIGLAKEF
ncbi:MAG: TorF family putative porin [Phycisphaerales bacterium]